MERFDVIVIGTGVSGQTAAEELARAGRNVAAVDKREFGGTCALRGCEPKKVLWAAAEAVERADQQVGTGPAGTMTLDWPSLMAFKRLLTDPASARIEKTLTTSGVTAIHGVARFVDEATIDVDGARYGAEHFVVATGAVPMPLGIPGEQHVIDHEAFMSAESLGRRIVFIGGGLISFEFAHIAAATGAQVTIVHRGTHVLKGFDPDLAEMLSTGYREAGIGVRTSAPVAEVRRLDGGGLEVELADGSAIDCDTVVHGAGRTPDLAGLDLEAGGIATNQHGITVDSEMRSVSNPRVFAAGDAASLGPPLTPVGIRQARVARANILEPGSAQFAPQAIPSAVFSNPPLASIGISEAEATARGLDVAVKLIDRTGWVSSRRTGTRISGSKTIVERGTGRILGAHLLGHGADEVINVFAAAMAGGLTAEDLRSAIWAYPTDSSEIVYLV
jgi:glutathione reductase (NADPH)